MKKFLAIFLAILMVATLAACGGGGETPETPDAPDATEAPVAGEVHGIKVEAYAAMTADDLIAKLIKDKTAPTVEEYAALIETIELAELDERFNFADNATNDALVQLKSDGATLPNILDCANAVIANDSAKVRAYYYSRLGNVFFDDTTAYYAPIKAKVISETEPIAIAYAFRYLASNFRSDAEFCDFVLANKDNENFMVRKWFSSAVTYLQPADKTPFVDAVIKLLGDEDVDVVTEAALNCGTLEDDRLVEPLAKILKDENLADAHDDALTSLIRMWYDYPAHDNYSEAAYKATMDYLKGDYASADLPSWLGLSKMATKGTKYDAWAAKATYVNNDEIVEAAKNIFEDETKARLVRTQCISIIGVFGDKADLEALQATIDKVESASDKSSYQSKLDAELAKK